VWVPHLGRYLTAEIDNGAFTIMFPTRSGSYRDGMSHTLAFAEKLIGSGERPFQPSRDWINVMQSTSLTADQWGDECARAFGPILETYGGLSWLRSWSRDTEFVCSYPPNTPIPDCGAILSLPHGIIAARSLHPGGVNAAMMDGSVRWFASSIEVRVWRALGTRAGGEAESTDIASLP
jgi:prepilin-type processing-associated H-X9-DG protein